MTGALTWTPAERRGSARQPRNYLATRQTRVEAYEHANRECARIIRTDPARYAGLPLLWAESVLRHERQTDAEWRLVA